MKRVLLLLAILTIASTKSFAQQIVSKAGYSGIYDDASKTWILPPKFDNIYRLVDYVPDNPTCYACRRNGKMAIASSTGELTPFAFDAINGTHYGSMFVVKQDGKWGVVRADELIVFPFEYKSIVFNKNGDFTFSSPGHNTVKRSLAEMVAATKAAVEHVKYDEQFNEDIIKDILLPIVPAGADSQKIVEVPTTKTIEISDLSSLQLDNCWNGYFMSRDVKTNKSYIFDSMGHITGELKTTQIVAGFDSTPVAIVKLEDYSVAIIRPDASIVSIVKGIYSITSFVDGIALVQSSGSFITSDPDYYFINAYGEHIYNHLDYFLEENSTVFDHYFMAKLVRPIKENRRAFYKKGKYGFLDESGKIVISAKYEEVSDFSEGLAAVAIRDANQTLWGFIDREGNTVIEPKFSNRPSDFHEGFTVVPKKDRSYCYIDKSGAIRADGFSAAGRFFHGYAIANNPKSKLAYVLNSKAEIIANTYCQSRNSYYYSDDYFAGGNTLFSPVGEILRHFNVLDDLEFHEGISICKTKDMKGYVNDKGEWVVIFKQSEF